MSTKSNTLPEDVADKISAENKMMCVFVSFIIGTLVGVGIGYFMFVQSPCMF